MPGQSGLLPPQVCARGGAGAQFTELLGRLHFDDEVLEWVREALHASHADERREHEEAIKRLQAEYKRLERPHQRHVRRQARRAGGRALLRQDVGPMARGAEALPARDRAAPGRRQVLHGRGRRGFSNWRGTPKGCSNSRNRAKNAACSTSCYRTALGRTARWSPPSANPLICWRKRHRYRTRATRRATGAKSAKTEIWLGNQDSNLDKQSQSPLFYR